MFKKIVSIFLAALMLLSFPVFAEDVAETEVAKTDSGNMLFAKALDIIPADAVGTDIVTRLEFAKMFCNVMRTDIGLAPSTGITFTDVPAESTSVVATVSAMGIMNGVGGGMFAPDEPVTYTQALKAMVTFLGYAQNADAKGGYPYGCYTQAADLDLIGNPPADINAGLTYEKAVSLFKRALNVDYRVPISFEDDGRYEIIKGLTYLHHHRDIVRTRGIVVSTPVSDISGEGITAYNKLRIDETVFEFSPAKINGNEYFGRYVDVYADSETKKVMFIEDIGTTVTELHSSEIAGLSGNNIEYYNESGKTKKLKISDDTRVLYNGTMCRSYNESDINPFTGTSKEGGITAIDNTGDGICDIICVDAYDTYIVKKVVDSKIYAEDVTGIMFDLEANAEYKEGKDYLIYNIIGEPIPLSEIQSGDIISVSADKNGKVTRIVLSIDKLVGMVDAVKNHNSRMYITVNGKEFECSNAVAVNPETAELKIGTKACLSFNKDGIVSHINQDEYNFWDTGYITGYAEGAGLDATKLVKFFGADGKWHIMDIAEKIYINEASSLSGAEDFITAATVDDSGDIKRQPIMYKTNAAGELKHVVFPTVDEENYDTVKMTSPFYMLKAMRGARDGVLVMADGVNALYYGNKDMGFQYTAFYSKGVVTFSVPPEDKRNDDSKYSIVDQYTLYEDWSNNAVIALYAQSEHPIINVAVKIEHDELIMDPKTYAMVVEKIERFLDTDTGDDYTKVSGYVAGKYVEYTDPDDLLKIGPDGAYPDRGDIIRVIANKYSEVTKAEYHFDASTKEMYNGGVKIDGGASDYDVINPRFVYGTVKFINEDIMLVSTKAQDLSDTEMYYTLENHIYTKVTKTGKGNIIITSATMADLVDSDNYGEAASHIVVHTNAGRPLGVTIYEGF